MLNYHYSIQMCAVSVITLSPDINTHSLLPMKNFRYNQILSLFRLHVCHMQEYTMECDLCGWGQDTVSVLPDDPRGKELF